MEDNTTSTGFTLLSDDEVVETAEETTEETTEVVTETTETTEVVEETTTETTETQVEPVVETKPEVVETIATTPPAPERDPFEAIGLAKDDTLGRKLVEAYLAGDLENFTKAHATDWTKVPDLDIVRQKLENQYKDLDREDRDFMVSSELEKYNTDSFDEVEARKAKIALKLEAKAIRDGLMAEQASYKVPERNVVSPEQLAEQQRQQQEQEAFEKQLYADPFITQFESSRSVKIGEGEHAFTYVVPGLDVKAEIANPLEAFFIREEGKIPRFDVKGFTEAVAFHKNKADFTAKLAEHYMALGEKRKDAALRGLSREKGATAPTGGGKGYTYLGDV